MNTICAHCQRDTSFSKANLETGQYLCAACSREPTLQRLSSWESVKDREYFRNYKVPKFQSMFQPWTFPPFPELATHNPIMADITD